MVNMRSPSPTSQGTNGSGDAYTLVEMCVFMDKLRRHNQTLEDDIHNIGQHQQESNPPLEMELLNT